MKLTNKHQEEFDINNVKIPRTIESTIFEAVGAVLLIAAWVISLAKHQFSGTVGEQWQTGIIVLSIAVVALLACSYYPHAMKNSHRFTNYSQVLLSVRMCRILAIEIAVALLCNAISGATLTQHPIAPKIFLGVVIITAIACGIFIRRAK